MNYPIKAVILYTPLPLRLHWVSHRLSITDSFQFMKPYIDIASAEKSKAMDLFDKGLGVFMGGNTKEKYLLRPGTTIFGNGGVLVFEPKSGSTKGVEIGSVARTNKPFLVQDIQFGIWENSIPDCVVSVNIYRIEGKDEEFVNVADSEKPQEFHAQPGETVLLEPGKYFISFQIVDCNEKALEEYLQVPESERDWSHMRLSTILYFKSSYTRKAALGKIERYPVNIGMVVKGLE